MIELIDRLRAVSREFIKRPLVPTVLIVIGVVSPDPNRRATGYGGVLPLPAPSVATPLVASGRADPLLDSHRDARAARGRVLYAAGHAPRDTAATARSRRHMCPEQRVVQARPRASSAPNS